jgi:hypothetical protein
MQLIIAKNQQSETTLMNLYMSDEDIKYIVKEL